MKALFNTVEKTTIPLDLPSEGISMWEQPGFPQMDYGAFQMRGPCVSKALQEAFVEAQKDRPTFHANLMEERKGFFYGQWWHVRPEPARLKIVDFRNLPTLPEDIDAWVHAQMNPLVMRGQNLLKEYAVSFRLFLLPREHQILVFMFHHVVTDGAGLYDFLRDTFSLYHRKVKNREPDWANTPGIHAQSKKNITEPISPFRYFLRSYRTDMQHPFKNASQLASLPERSKGRVMIRHIITDLKEQKAFRTRARADGGSVTDLFMAASKLAMQEFNDSRNTSTEILTHGLAVNLRGRMSPSEIHAMGNPMSAIILPTNRRERHDPQALLRLIVQRRMLMLHDGYDIAVNRVMQSISRKTRFLPSTYRYPLMRLVLDWPISFFLTNLGVVWPRMENGRPTGETAITHVGEMELVDVHSSVSPTKNNALAMILRTFLGRFYCVFAVGLNKISEKDAKEFSRLILGKARSYL